MPPTRKKQQYSEEQMQSAIDAINKDGIAVTESSRIYGIPRQTLTDRICKKYQRVGSGRPSELTQEEEVGLVKYIKSMADSGHPLSVLQKKSLASGIVKGRTSNTRFSAGGPGWSWWRGFKKRHSKHFTLQKPDNLDHDRSSMANQTSTDKYFQTLKEALEKDGLYNKPAHVFNCDESGINIGQRVGKVVVPSVTKHPCSKQRAPRDHITTHVCCSAAGQVLPPMIIFEKCWPSAPYAKHGPDGALYAKSENGYINEELFVKWMKKIFIPHTAMYRPCILITDGHGSHITNAVKKTASELNITILHLPLRTTHILQPLDVGVLGAFKSNTSKIIDGAKLLSLSEQYSQLNKTNFTAVFKLAFERTMSLASIKNGFRKCGIYPYNPEAIDKNCLMPTIPASVPQIETSSSSSIVSTPVQSMSVDFNVNEATISKSTTHVLSVKLATTAVLDVAVASKESAPETSNMSSPSSPETSGTSANSSMSSEILKYANIPLQLADSIIIPIPSVEKKKLSHVVIKAGFITSDEYQSLLKAKIGEKKKQKLKKRRRKDRGLKKLDKKQKNSKSKGEKRAPKKKRNDKDFERDSEDENINLDDTIESKTEISEMQLSGRSARNKAKKLIELLRKECTDNEESEDDENSEEDENREEDENSEDLKDICATCFKENDGLKSEHVEWVHCDACEKWYHASCEKTGSKDISEDTYTCIKCKALGSG